MTIEQLATPKPTKFLDRALQGAEHTQAKKRFSLEMKKRLSSRGVVATVIVAIALSSLPVLGHHVGPSIGFMPAMVAIITVFNLMSMYLVVAIYREDGDLRGLVTSWAYLWSLILLLGYALSFPGAVSVNAPLATTPSTVVWLYLGWHAGFPILLGTAWLPWPRRWNRPTPSNRRALTLGLSTAVVAGIAALTIAGIVEFSRNLPTLIVGRDLSLLTSQTARFVLPVVAASVISTYWGTRHRTGAERWVAIAALSCLADLSLTYIAEYRYSVGWYMGRSLGIFASAVVLMAVLASFRRLKFQAEYHAVTDALTGLSNRRSCGAALKGMIARAQRSGEDLSMLILDVDHFKQVNDRFGHSAGDNALIAIGKLLAGTIRLGDVAARYGGEEFLVIPPDANEDFAMRVAERIRHDIAELHVNGIEGPITVSIGAGSLDKSVLDDDGLFHRIDRALYKAKASGRNTTVRASTVFA